jgi:hypothetical protein
MVRKSILTLTPYILFIHPYLEEWLHHSPALMLLILVAIAAHLIPLHHRIEHWVLHTLIARNKRLRLAAAKRTVAKLEKNDAPQQ